MLARVGTTWRPTEAHVRVISAWMRVKNIYARVGTTWRPTWSYSWKTGSFGGCSANCGGGTQTRTVTCTRNDGRTMPDAFCSDVGTKPATSQPCNTHPCYSYSWNWGSWGSCSANCGYGTQYRSVWCQRNDGVTVSDSYCSGSKPSTSTSCNHGTCRWYIGNWGDCNSTCKGTQYRTVECRRNGSWVPDSYCTGSKQSTSRNCDPQPCKCSFSDSIYLANKVKQLNGTRDSGRTNWTAAEAERDMKALCDTFQNHFEKYGKNEGVCPYPTECCYGFEWK